MRILLEASHVKHYVQDRLLLNIDQLQIHENERIGLVGRNGSGKTTLLKILAEKFIPDEGTITSYVSTDLLPQLKRTDRTKSGGEITQEYIQEILNHRPALFFADEPTTNLDTNHIHWIEKKLKNWQGACVIVSHDRSFLDNLCSKIWEIEEGKITEYTGNYSDYQQQKQLEEKQEQLASEKYQRERKQLKEAIQQKKEQAQRATKKPKDLSRSEARILGAKTYYANQQKKLQKTASAMEKRLENLEKIEKTKEMPPIKMDLPNEENFKNRIILRAESLNGKVGNRKLWNKTDFFVRGGDKLAIIGANGSGKTTLVKKIINQAPGITLSPSVKIGYFAQNLNILNHKDTILENVKSSSKQAETLIRTVLARLHFFDDDVYKPIHVLSGGERVKVALAKIFVSEANTLILDEPTNYLDIEALEALETLLKEYEGTIIFVSHDRRFIENIATRVMVIENQAINIFEGTYQQFTSEQTEKSRDIIEDKKLILETRITEILSRLSI
ncbi:MAG TPA: Vga family ABC-F type ribosomal protection protein, partial [Pseudogracilibacillus sp.]|nr:Vga family ABC-F type ribosomal protection protein [Pseudogracilibacillus sp.]